jgi:hypothetical protein
VSSSDAKLRMNGSEEKRVECIISKELKLYLKYDLKKA